MVKFHWYQYLLPKMLFWFLNTNGQLSHWKLTILSISPDQWETTCLAHTISFICIAQLLLFERLQRWLSVPVHHCAWWVGRVTGYDGLRKECSAGTVSSCRDRAAGSMGSSVFCSHTAWFVSPSCSCKAIQRLQTQWKSPSLGVWRTKHPPPTAGVKGALGASSVLTCMCIQTNFLFCTSYAWEFFSI